jgi:hypothetical protein
MFSLFGAAVFVVKIVGIAIIVVTLLAALLYHLGWRNDHPNGFWPTRALVGFSGILLAGTGLIIGSVLTVIIGVSAYLCSLVLSPGPSAPPPL